MKLEKTIKWLFISVSALIFSFISIMFIAAIINLKAEQIDKKVQSDYIQEEMRTTIKHNDFHNDFEKETENLKDTANEIQVPEYESFEEYVPDMMKHFNGESELKNIYAEDNLKYHLVVTSTNYLKYYNKNGEIPNELQKLVDDGIKVTNHFENSDDPNEYYNKLKRIHEQLEKNINIETYFE